MTSSTCQMQDDLVTLVFLRFRQVAYFYEEISQASYDILPRFNPFPPQSDVAFNSSLP